jgi:endoglucanase
MKHWSYRQFLLILASLCLSGAGAEKRDLAADNRAAYAAVAKLRVGVNLGNAMEAPNEGDWGWKLEEDDFKLISEAGFQSIRLPVRWTTHAETKPPYTISPDFFKRVDWALEQARINRLYVVLNIHHFDEIMADPAANRERLLALWDQIAKHYADHASWLLFEILNEPRDGMTAELWNQYLAEALTVIRQSNPNRIVVIGPANWNNFASFPKLKLPEKDRLLVATFHYYNPFHFTHQGADWVKDSSKWMGMTWRGTPDEKGYVRKDLDGIAEWARTNRRPVLLGEFGSNEKVDMKSRICWTKFIREEALSRGMAAIYWEYCAHFGVYNRETQTWRQPLVEALVGKKMKK